MEEFKGVQKGEVTIFLCLVFLVLISLVGALMESVSVRLTRNERRINLEMALESVFAEYDQLLLDEYEIFALNGTYGTGKYEQDLLLSRLDFYGAENTENQIHAVEFLSDNGGNAFYRQAVQYMRNKYGLREEIDEDKSDWASNAEQAEDYLEEFEETQKEIESLPAEDNPIVAIEDVKKQGLVNVVLPKDKEVSNLSLQTERLPSARELQKGNCSSGKDGDLLSDAMFREYILEQFYSYASGKETRSLTYEIEYLLGGKAKDAKNLENVLQKLLCLRMVPNYTCLMSDTVRKTEANLLATSLCALIQTPGLAVVAEQAILLAWAYGESVAELQILMDGGLVSTVKTKNLWILSLEDLPLIGSKRYTKEDGEESGMDYQEYLRVLLMLYSREKLCMRALDLMECDLGFPVDSCITRLQIASTFTLRRNLSYKFQTQYAYR